MRALFRLRPWQKQIDSQLLARRYVHARRCCRCLVVTAKPASRRSWARTGCAPTVSSRLRWMSPPDAGGGHHGWQIARMVELEPRLAEQTQASHCDCAPHTDSTLVVLSPSRVPYKVEPELGDRGVGYRRNPPGLGCRVLIGSADLPR